MGERAVLGHKQEWSRVGFQWTGAEPEGLDDPKLAEILGAVWEGDELVSYDVEGMKHRFEHIGDDFLTDPD